MHETLLNIYVFVDDFFIVYEAHFESSEKELLPIRLNSRCREHRMFNSEIMTIILCFHLSGFKTFEKFYVFIQKYYKKEFPYLLSYNQFLELKQKLLFPLLIFFSVISAQCDGTSYIDSTHIPVCHIKRELLHKVFKGIARKSKSTMG